MLAVAKLNKSSYICLLCQQNCFTPEQYFHLVSDIPCLMNSIPPYLVCLVNITRSLSRWTCFPETTFLIVFQLFLWSGRGTGNISTNKTYLLGHFLPCGNPLNAIPSWDGWLASISHSTVLHLWVVFKIFRRVH